MTMNRLQGFLQRFKKQASAQTAKERLQIIISHQRSEAGGEDFLPRLRQEIVEVIKRYMDVDPNQVIMHHKREGECSVLELELKIALPKGRARVSDEVLE